ncbi:MAG: hypothetical protein KDE27_26885 [Planctomycetes bacterium]|nr:hypothetical protein [Planctomycetota bacterium]
MSLPRTSLSRLVLPLLLVAACTNGELEPPICTGLAEPAVVVDLRDAATKEPIVGATARLSDDSGFDEAMYEGPPGTYSGGHERPGTYRVDIAAAGYASAERADVTAPAGTCGPVTQYLAIELSLATAPIDLPVILLVESGSGTWDQVPAVLHAGTSASQR